MDGKDVNHITSYTDVVPSLLDLCKIEYNPTSPFEGESLVSLMKDPESSWKSRTIITDTQRKEFLVKWKDASIMTDQYRLIRGEELYDFEKDPGQTTDIAAFNPEVVETLRNEYENWWARVSQRSDEINPIPVGFDEKAVTLTCHDIHADDNAMPAWNQTQVRLNKNPNGFWIIDVKQKGKYSIAVHRYPVESGAGFRAQVAVGDDIDGGKPYPLGMPIAVSKVKLKVGEVSLDQNIDADAKNAVFELELNPGEQELKTWLIDEDEKEVGAYYVYIQRI